MAKYIKIEVENGRRVESLNGFLSSLLMEKIVDSLLVPQRLFSNVVQTLVKDATRLKEADPVAPVMPVNSARIVSDLTVFNPDEKIGVTLRPCEIRALIELVKLNQASVDNLLIIGADCLGTYSVPDYAEFLKGVGEGNSPGEAFLTTMETGSDTSNLRNACQICEYPVPEKADLTFLLIGTDSKKEVIVQAEDTLAEEIIERLNLKGAEKPPGRDEALSKLIEERRERKDKIFKEIREEIGEVPSLLSLFSTCIRCQNCRRACPICYCTECLFDTSPFKYTPEKYLRWVDKKGILRMPADTLLFHLTRMNHMITSCVGCGQCEDACPNDLPLVSIFRALGATAQEVFGYIPGRDVEDELPLATFREEELEPR